MKTLSGFLAVWLLGTAAAAQEAPVEPPRGDVHFVVGWQNLRREQPQGVFQDSNDWMNAIFYGGTGAGWYWTEHLKTQVDFGAGTRGRQYRYRPDFTGSFQDFRSSELTVNSQSVAIGQHYQFFRNQWFHPHVGAGVDIARETTREEFDAVFGFDNAARTTRVLVPARSEGPDHRFVARPFVETGFKAYMTRRAFFTSDMRLMVRGGIDEVLFRLGFGVDF
jgi:hypothetical protein